MPKKRQFKGAEPLAEQSSKARYELETVTEAGQIVGRVYRRKPLFETMFLRGDITREQLAALRYYRERYELCHHSPTRCCLATTFGRGQQWGGASPLSSRAAQEVEIMESSAGLFLHALRAVAIEDKSFNKAAMDRYGSRQINIGGVERIVPKTKTHSRRIKAEFFTALECFLPVAQSFFVSNFSVDFLAHTSQHKSNCGTASNEARI